MHGANRVMKACMYRTWIDKVTNTQLTYKTKALKIRMGDQVKDQRAGNGNKSIDRIVDDFVFVQRTKVIEV